MNYILKMNCLKKLNFKFRIQQFLSNLFDTQQKFKLLRLYFYITKRFKNTVKSVKEKKTNSEKC